MLDRADSTTTQGSETRRSRRRRELHQSILATAAELFARDGFEATTVETIAAAADIAPATFFNHFQSKSGLLAEITADVVATLEALIEQHLRAEASVREQLVGLAHHATEMLVEHHQVSREVMLEMLRAGTGPEDSAPHLARLHRPITAMIALGQERGEVRLDQDAEFLAEMVLGALQATLTQWLSDEAYPIAERLPRAASFLWEAIRAPASSAATSEKPRGPRP